MAHEKRLRALDEMWWKLNELYCEHGCERPTCEGCPVRKMMDDIEGLEQLEEE